MDKQRLSINVWKPTYVGMPHANKISGFSGYISLNGGTILLTTRQRKMTPFQALYGCEPPKWKDFAIIETKLPAVKNQLKVTQKVVQTLKENLNNARNCMKQQAN